LYELPPPPPVHIRGRPPRASSAWQTTPPFAHPARPRRPPVCRPNGQGPSPSSGRSDAASRLAPAVPVAYARVALRRLPLRRRPFAPTGDYSTRRRRGLAHPHALPIAPVHPVPSHGHDTDGPPPLNRACAALGSALSLPKTRPAPIPGMLSLLLKTTGAWLTRAISQARSSSATCCSRRTSLSASRSTAGRRRLRCTASTSSRCQGCRRHSCGRTPWATRLGSSPPQGQTARRRHGTASRSRSASRTMRRALRTARSSSSSGTLPPTTASGGTTTPARATTSAPARRPRRPSRSRSRSSHPALSASRCPPSSARNPRPRPRPRRRSPRAGPCSYPRPARWQIHPAARPRVRRGGRPRRAPPGQLGLGEQPQAADAAQAQPGAGLRARAGPQPGRAAVVRGQVRRRAPAADGTQHERPARVLAVRGRGRARELAARARARVRPADGAPEQARPAQLRVAGALARRAWTRTTSLASTHIPRRRTSCSRRGRPYPQCRSSRCRPTAGPRTARLQARRRARRFRARRACSRSRASTRCPSSPTCGRARLGRDRGARAGARTRRSALGRTSCSTCPGSRVPKPTPIAIVSRVLKGLFRWN
jgi:hypothetical protein